MKILHKNSSKKKINLLLSEDKNKMYINYKNNINMDEEIDMELKWKKII